MPGPERLEKAALWEIKWNKKQQARPVNPDKTVKVQFNPETLTVNFSNQKAGGDQRGGSAIQFVGQGTTKLSLDLWFDATVDDAEDDVRKLTEKVNYFIKPTKKGSGKNAKWIAPGVRFIWGTFLFDGIIDSINEKLEYFSEDGKPLRSMLSISISSQSIQFEFAETTSGGLQSQNTPATRPQHPAKAGDTVQRIAQTDDRGDDWQRIAEANGIENPRQIPPGTLIDTNLE